MNKLFSSYQHRHKRGDLTNDMNGTHLVRERVKGDAATTTSVTPSRDVEHDEKSGSSSPKSLISMEDALLEDDLDVEGAALAVEFLALANAIILKMKHRKYNIVMIMKSPQKRLRDMFAVPLMLVAQSPEPSHLSLMFWRSLFCSRVIMASEKLLVKDEFFLNAYNPL